MIKSGKLIEFIVQNLNFFREELKSKAKLGLLNQHIFSENLVMKILNIVFNLDLQPLNKKTSNFPGLDLGDEKNMGIAFQVTSQNDLSKINETLKTCIEKQHYRQFKTIKIFILSTKKNWTGAITETKPHFQFNKDSDILDFDDLFLEIKNLSKSKLESIYDLIKDEFQNSPIEPESQAQEELPELFLDLSETFKIDLTDEEVEIYLMEVFQLISMDSEKFHHITVRQEKFFLDRLEELNKPTKTIPERKEQVEIKSILNEFSKLKKAIDLKIKMFYFTDKYPISKSYSHLTISLREIVEKLSFPYSLVEETIYNSYFPMKAPEQAKKFQGRFKFDIFKLHRSGIQLGCSVWLTNEEILEIKNRQDFFSSKDDDEFFNSYLQFFSFEPIHFEKETLAAKVIPAFVDRFYDFKNDHYKYIKKDDFSTWTDLTNYQIGLG